VGNVPPPADPQAITVESTPTPHLAWTEHGIRHQVWITAEGRPARLRLAVPGGGDRLSADFEWSGAGGLLAVLLMAPDRGAELKVRYLSAEYIENPPDAFRLTIPAGVPVQQLD
jgi:hypothetical protein